MNSSRQPAGDQLDWTKLQPPPYLLGTTLLVWGALSGQHLIGLMAAFFLESHRWVEWRWSFSDQDYIRVWNLCVALFLIVAVFQVVGQEIGRWQITRAFQKWMPLLLFPMIWAQSFSKGRHIPMLTFSLVARRKRIYDERAGRRLREPRRADLGYFYFAVLLLSIGAVGRKAPSVAEFLHYETRSSLSAVNTVYVLAALLIGWALTAFIARRGWLVAGCLLLIACFAGHHVHIGLQVVHGLVEKKTMEWISGRGRGDGNQSRTSFGTVGELKQSPRVFWRALHKEGTQSNLLPESIYHQYSDRYWFNVRNFKHFDHRHVIKVENQKQWEIDNLAMIDSTSVIEIRGRAEGRHQLLPRLDDTALIYDLDAAFLEKNPLGTLRAQPTYSTIKYTVYAGPVEEGRLELAPNREIDYTIHKRERAKIKEVADSLEVPLGAPPSERILAVQQFFSNPANGFTYTKWLEGIGVSDLGQELSHVGLFLSERGRSGHCEYYATATVLLLRALGIPARYVVGYAMQEKDPETGEYLLRGTHRHAWARAWDSDLNRWLNIDTTPSNWLAVETKTLSAVDAYLQKWDHWMLSWNLWRRADDKGLLWTLLPLLLAGGLLIIVVLRLVRGLKRSREAVGNSQRPHEDLTLLGLDSAWFPLEKALQEHCYPRQASQSVAHWCKQLVTIHPEWRQDLPWIVDTHTRYRFDPNGVPEKERQRFNSAVEEFHARLAQSTPVSAN